MWGQCFFEINCFWHQGDIVMFSGIVTLDFLEPQNPVRKLILVFLIAYSSVLLLGLDG